MPTTDDVDMPRPRTTVGYSSLAISGTTTNDDEMPILPTQYSTSVTMGSAQAGREKQASVRMSLRGVEWKTEKETLDDVPTATINNV